MDDVNKLERDECVSIKFEVLTNALTRVMRSMTKLRPSADQHRMPITAKTNKISVHERLKGAMETQRSNRNTNDGINMRILHRYRTLASSH